MSTGMSLLAIPRFLKVREWERELKIISFSEME